ncbi:MAG: hypothetical protein HUN04_22055 [Desulfobacter sp.]|nr:MAG: hypothetical protein HUN04_22055 [Desulfobacter sp.]
MGSRLAGGCGRGKSSKGSANSLFFFFGLSLSLDALNPGKNIVPQGETVYNMDINPRLTRKVKLN